MLFLLVSEELGVLEFELLEFAFIFRLRCLPKLELYLFLLDRTLLLMSLRTRKVSLP